jgi:heat shock protein HslJ
MSRTARIVLIVIAIVAIVALAVWLVSRSGGGGTPADPLAGSNWQVRSYYNPAVSGGMASPLGGTQLTAEFAGAKVAGSSGCNTYSASYTVDGSSLTIGAVSSTRMACAEPPGVMEQEAAFLAALQSASSFKLGTGVLQILNGQGQVAVDLIPYTPAPTAIPPAATTAAPTDTPVPAAPTATATPTATETPVPGAPVISRFTAEPQGEITLGQCVALAWEVQGQVESVTLSADNKVIMSPAPAAGNTSDCPSRARAVTYILEAKGPGGTARGTQTLNVVEAPTETPVPPTATPEAPVIDSFSVSPGQVEAGACFTISWNASGGVASSRILRDKTVINDTAGPERSRTASHPAAGGERDRGAPSESAGWDELASPGPRRSGDPEREPDLAGNHCHDVFQCRRQGERLVGLQHLHVDLRGGRQQADDDRSDRYQGAVLRACRHHGAGGSLPDPAAEGWRVRDRRRQSESPDRRWQGAGAVGRFLV